MIILRSIAFQILFYVNFVIMALILSPLLLGPRSWGVWTAKSWTASSIWLLRVVAGTRLEIRGLENLPDGPFLLASKHQSALETVALVPIIKEPIFILKRELMYLPIFGWYALKMQMIPVDRGARSQALKAITEHGRVTIAKGRQIIIFPEGTRRPVGAAPSYKWGVAHIYTELGVPCVPAALNTGLFWPRNSLLRFPGTAVIEFLPPIPPGLNKETFLTTLSERIEPASDALVAEARRDSPSVRGSL
jgi:1-acyl-sn-glycerol-3-phosphate acyltransferase